MYTVLYCFAFFFKILHQIKVTMINIIQLVHDRKFKMPEVYQMILYIF